MKTIKVTLPNPCDTEHEILHVICSIRGLCVIDKVKEAQRICFTVIYTNADQLLFVILSVIYYSKSNHHNFSIQ